MLISRRGYNWNKVCHQTGGPITGWAYNREGLQSRLYRI